jgi:transposase
MKISEIAKILQVHKSTSWINEFKKEGGKNAYSTRKEKEKKKVNEREIKVGKSTRKNI